MMKTIKRYLNRYDVILILVIVLVAGGIFAGTVFAAKAGGQVRIQVEGKETGTYSLKTDQEVQILGGENTLRIKDGQAKMITATCPDHLCVNHKPISKNGESIICLPHKVVVTVESDQLSELDSTTN
ncbi:hypothetical protein M2149_000044 [Lachnospiraceae bacterium PFB1-21]